MLSYTTGIPVTIKNTCNDCKNHPDNLRWTRYEYGME
jgi:hypothetical protein